MSVEGWAARLAVAEARAAVEYLVASYAALLDAGDFAGVGELFAHGEIHSRPEAPVRRGRTDVTDMFAAAVRLYPDGTPRTKHVTTNLLIAIETSADGDPTSATCRSYFTVLQEVHGHLALQPIIAGRYHDEFQLIDEQWCFRSRQMFGDLYGDLGHHMLFDLRPPQS